MELSARHVGELVDELAPLVVGRRISEVVGLPPRDLLFVLEPRANEDEEGARVRRLRVSAEPGCARLHLQVGRMRRRETAKAPFFQRAAELLAALPRLYVTGTPRSGLRQVGPDDLLPEVGVYAVHRASVGSMGRAEAAVEAARAALTRWPT